MQLTPNRERAKWRASRTASLTPELVEPTLSSLVQHRCPCSLDGEGTHCYGGSSSSPGTRLSYTSEHQSLATLAYFVHLDMDDPPGDLVLAVAETLTI
jgi:RES domain-containing protein